jgi:hypothetical protein
MTYQTYADHHLVPRIAPPTDECETMRQPKETCCCPDCCDSRYPAELVESDGGEV